MQNALVRFERARLSLQDAVRDFVTAGVVHYEYDAEGGCQRLSCTSHMPNSHPTAARRACMRVMHCCTPRMHACDAVRPKAGTHGPQVALYDRCLRRWGAAHTFMAFIDTDEFIVLRDATSDLPALVSSAHLQAMKSQSQRVPSPGGVSF
jgi:hypothetical protein